MNTIIPVGGSGGQYASGTAYVDGSGHLAIDVGFLPKLLVAYKQVTNYFDEVILTGLSGTTYSAQREIIYVNGSFTNSASVTYSISGTALTITPGVANTTAPWYYYAMA